MNGFKARLHSGELQRLIQLHRPVCLCLQHIGPYIISPKGYQLAACTPHHEGHLRTAILVRNDHPYSTLTLNPAPFQTVSVFISLPNLPRLAICSSYNQPSCPSSASELPSILAQLPPTYLILGDFNAHSPIWGGSYSDTPGSHIEHILSTTTMCCLNDGAPTYRSTAHGSYSAVDLSLASDITAPHFDWAVLDDRFSSDHYPILLQHTASTPTTQIPQYNLSKANWDLFRLLSRDVRNFN